MAIPLSQQMSVFLLTQLTLQGSGRTQAAGAEFELVCRRCFLPLGCLVPGLGVVVALSVWRMALNEFELWKP